MISLDLAVNAVVAGLLLGGFYAAVTVGVTISFGMLDIVNIAHPAFIMLGSFVAYVVNSNFGIDPILIGVVMAPVFFLVGMAVYQIYYYAFEQRGEESIQGLAFFFGLLFVGEVALILVFGVDYRFVEAPYIGPSLHFGFVDLPLRMLIPCLVSLLMLAVLQVFLGRTFIGRAILAVSQDRLALQLMAANPSRVKRIAFGISIATASVAGALLIIIQPVEPSIGRDYIGPSLHFGFVDLPLRMLIPFLVSLLMIAVLQLFLGRTFIGRAILAVSQDRLALQLMAANPSRIKRIAFGLSIATASVAGALLIIIQPVEPSIGRDYIGRIFAICVLGGMTSFPGMLAGAVLIGIVESITSTFYGPSWAPAVAFGFLLLTLAVRPAGILGR